MLSLVSLGWIVFVGYDLLDRRDRISPNHIFTEKDGEILIINRSEEVRSDELGFSPHPEIAPLFDKLMKHVFQNERIYLSEERPLIIVELPRIWNADLVSDYLVNKELEHYFSKNGEIVLQKHFLVRFRKNHLMISKEGHSIRAHEEENWPLWDGKASASIIHLKKPLKSTNIYFRENGTVAYQTKYGPLMNCRKVDDYDYFAQFLPSKLEKYHFFEKEFALKSHVIREESPLYQWMEDGMVQFEYDGVNCLLSDYNKSIDPMQMLLSDSDESPEMTNRFRNIRLTKDFPSDPGQGFYIGKVGDKVLAAEKKEALERIIADYQLGNTLALDAGKTAEVYGKMPKKVSERVALSPDFYTLSSYKNLLIRTSLASAEETDAGIAAADKKTENTATENSSFSTGQETDYLLGNGNIVFAIGKQNEIIALSNKKQIWKISLEGNIIGRVKLIDIHENGKQQLLLSTDRKIYVINAQTGGNVNEFPLAMNIRNSVSTYRWNGQSHFLAVNTNNELVQIDEIGRAIRRLKITAADVEDEVDVYKNGKVLTAVITGSNRAQAVDLDRNRILKFSANIPKKHLQLKSESNFVYFVREGNILQKYTLDNRKTAIVNAKDLGNVKKIYRGKEQFVAYRDKNTIVVLDNRGNAVQRITVAVEDIEDFDIITTRNGNTYLAVLEGIENNIYLFDSAGKKIADKSFEGKERVKLSEDQGRLTITSSLDRNIIQHYDVLK